MVQRPVLAVTVLALALGATVGIAGDASAKTIKTYMLQPKEFDPETEPPENWGRDTFVSEAEPDKNFKNEEVLETSAVSGQRKEIILRFPLDQGQSWQNKTPLPANLSISQNDTDTGAQLVLYYRDSMDDDEMGRDLALYKMRRSWDEGGMDWDEARENENRDLVDLSPAEQTLQRDRSRAWDVSSYMADVLNPDNPAPFNGFLIRDDDPGSNCGTPPSCVQEFYSSNHLEHDEGNSAKGCDAVEVPDKCLPKLVLDARLNRPQAVNLTYTGGHDGKVVAPEERLNFSADIWDPAGELTDAVLRVHHENGTEMFRENIWGNRSDNLTSFQRPQDGSSFQFWWNASLDLPEDRYTFNLTVRDTDDNFLRTDFRDPNVTVEDEDPLVSNPNVTPDVLDGAGTVNFGLHANDTWGIEKAWAVLNHTDRPPVETDDFEPEEFIGEDGNGTYNGSHDVRFPGVYEVVFKVEDRPGNVRSVQPCDLDPDQPCAIEVEDNEDPLILEACILDDGRCPNLKQGQEIGGDLTFFLRATDNHPRRPQATLVLESPDGRTLSCTTGGAPEWCETETAGSDVWRYTVSFDDETRWTTGDWEAVWRVEDPDGNVQDSGSGIPFLVEAAQPPRLTEVAPQPWSSAEPSIAATVEDVNVDPDRVDVAVSVNDARFEPVPSTSERGRNRAIVTAQPGPYVHGDDIAVRVTATDTFNRTGTGEWTFTVDDRDPVADLSYQGDVLEGLRLQVVEGSTHLTFSGNDTGSGLDRVEYRLAFDDAPFGPWRDADGPVNLTRDPGFVGSGPYRLEYRAVDAVGNEGRPTAADVYVDTEAPRIDWSRDASSVTLDVDDPGAGIDDVRVFYRNGSSSFTDLDVNLRQKTPDGGIYQADLPFAPEGTSIQVYFAAVDRLGHVETLGQPGVSGERPIRWQQPNHPPNVGIVSPEEGDALQGSVPVVWETSDPDGDPVDPHVTTRPVVLEEWTEVADVPRDTNRAQWDTTGFPDGRYQLRVTADDGRNVSHATVTVDVDNTDRDVADVSLPQDGLQPGRESPISVTIYREVASVEATVFVEEDGGRRSVATVPLRDDGLTPDRTAGDGTHTGSFTPREDATYSMALDVTYADGSSETMDDVVTFTAETSFAEQLEANQDVVAVAGTILVVLAAATVIQLYRYGYI